MGWMHRLAAHPRVADALAAGQVSASYARKICEWSDMLPPGDRDFADQVLTGAAVTGADLGGLGELAEEMLSRAAVPDADPAEEDARFRDRWFRVTRLFQGRGRADGDLTPECLAAVREVLDTLGKKAGPEDDRTVNQRRHDALEEAMRLLLASGCLPERAGQPAQVQLHMTLDQLLGLPGAPDLAGAWLSRLSDAQPGGTQPGSDKQHDDGGPADRGGEPGPGRGGGRPDLDEDLWPTPERVFTRPDPRAARSHAPGAGQAGWLRGTATEAYSCDAKIAPMVCGHLDRNVLARLAGILVHGRRPCGITGSGTRT